MSWARLRAGGVVAVFSALSLLAACSPSSPRAARPSGKLAAVAAEDVWGSLARQLGGDRVAVESVVSNPAADPHDYEPTPADARAIASADLVIANGIGYDPWIDRLLAANPSSKRIVVKVGDLLGLKEGDNPHQWYSPDAVEKVIQAVVASFERLAPSHAADFRRQQDAFEATALAPYHATIAAIRDAYAGVPVGASESIFAPMAAALGLQLLTPARFLDAIAEGNEPRAADKAEVDRQMKTKAIDVFVFNSQNATPDVQRLEETAKAHDIAVTSVTETIAPQGSTFQDWQTRQLQQLQSALANATPK